jgi:hypothetical protein
MVTEPSPDPQPTDDQAAGPPDPADDDPEGELLEQLANALQHVGSELEGIRQAIRDGQQRQERAWAATKRIESLTTHVYMTRRPNEEDDDHDRPRGQPGGF